MEIYCRLLEVEVSHQKMVLDQQFLYLLQEILSTESQKKPNFYWKKTNLS